MAWFLFNCAMIIEQCAQINYSVIRAFNNKCLTEWQSLSILIVIISFDQTPFRDLCIKTDIHVKFHHIATDFTANTSVNLIPAQVPWKLRRCSFKGAMRTVRKATPIHQSSQLEELPNPNIMLPRRSSSSSHLPSLREGSSDCNVPSRITTPHAFSDTEKGKTEIIALVGLPSHPRRGKLLKSALEKRSSHENSWLPNLIKRDLKENVQLLPSPSSEWVERVHRPQHYELTRTISHPVIFNDGKFSLVTKIQNDTCSNSLPQLNNGETPRKGTEGKHSADLRRHIEKEELDYDLFTTKAVILERFLNSQS